MSREDNTSRREHPRSHAKGVGAVRCGIPPPADQGPLFFWLLLRTAVCCKEETDHEERNMSEMKTDYAGMAHREIGELNLRRGLVSVELGACEGEGVIPNG